MPAHLVALANGEPTKEELWHGPPETRTATGPGFDFDPCPNRVGFEHLMLASNVCNHKKPRVDRFAAQPVSPSIKNARPDALQGAQLAAAEVALAHGQTWCLKGVQQEGRRLPLRNCRLGIPAASPKPPASAPVQTMTLTSGERMALIIS